MPRGADAPIAETLQLSGTQSTPRAFAYSLDQVGIDSAKEGEVYECGTEASLRLYGGWFYFAGELIEPGARILTLVLAFSIG